MNVAHVCVVCGAPLPDLGPVKNYLEKNCAIKIAGTGQVLFFCLARHTAEQVKEAAAGVPCFQTAMAIKQQSRLT